MTHNSAKQVSFDINSYLMAPRGEQLAPTVQCADGFSMSVQASPTHYSSPRHWEGPHSEVEVGFPYPREGHLYPFADGQVNALWVPDWLARKVACWGIAVRRAGARLRDRPGPLGAIGRGLYNAWVYWDWCRCHPVNKVYGYVPVELVNTIVANHSGLATVQED